MSARSEARRALVAAVALAGLVGGCSLGAAGRSDCTDARQCQLAFGFGSTCGDDGLCRRAASNPRCTVTFPENLLTDPAAHADTLVIGNLMDRSLETQQARERSAELAVRQANESGGFDGRDFGIVFCTIEEDSALDDLSRAEAAVASATYLVEELGIDAVVGPAASSDTQAVFTALRDSGALFISPSATSPALTDIDVTSPTDENPGRLWRTAPPDSLQGAVIAADMEARMVANVAVIHATGAYGEGLAREFERGFSGELTLFPFDNATVRDEAIATVGADAGFDEVLFISSQVTDAVSFLNASALLGGYDAKGIFLTDAAANADFLDGTRAAASARFPQVRGTRPAVPGGFVYDELFVTAYGAAFGEDVRMFSFTAHAYDAAWMLIYGTSWALLSEDELSGTTIARGLRRLSAGREFEVRAGNFQGIVQAFREGQTVDLIGASGSLDYDPATEETTAAIDVWTVSADGRSIVVDRTIQP